jgi:hypothetical protein
MPVDLTVFELRLYDIRGLAHASLRAASKPVADEYQQEIAALAEELLRAIEAEFEAARSQRR